MKALMLSACRQLEELLELRARDPVDYERQLKVYNRSYCHRWERRRGA